LEKNWGRMDNLRNLRMYRRKLKTKKNRSSLNNKQDQLKEKPFTKTILTNKKSSKIKEKSIERVKREKSILYSKVFKEILLI